MGSERWHKDRYVWMYGVWKMSWVNWFSSHTDYSPHQDFEHSERKKGVDKYSLQELKNSVYPKIGMSLYNFNKMTSLSPVETYGQTAESEMSKL